MQSQETTKSSRSHSGSIPRDSLQHGHICTWMTGNLISTPQKKRCLLRASVKFWSGHSEYMWVFYEVSVICAGRKQSLQTCSHWFTYTFPLSLCISFDTQVIPWGQKGLHFFKTGVKHIFFISQLRSPSAMEQNPLYSMLTVLCTKLMNNFWVHNVCLLETPTLYNPKL